MRKKSQAFFSQLLFAAFVVPVENKSQWNIVTYGSRIPANQLSFKKDGMHLKINKSSSPIIYSFGKSVKVSKVKLRATVKGNLPKIPLDKKQGDKGYDDFPLRLGLVKKGNRTLNWMERRMAPNWVVSLYKLAPKGMGIEGIEYLSVANQEKSLGHKRIHPLNDLLHEEVVSLVGKNGEIVIEKTFAKPRDVVALWLSADGDDTQTKFSLHIKEITIEKL